MQISNRAFRKVTIGVAIVLVPGLMVTGLLLITYSNAGTVPRSIGTALLSGSITSAAFFAVGWMVERNATRRRHSSDLVNAVTTDLVQLRNNAELAKFYVRLNHSAPTYRDRIGTLIAELGTVREDAQLIRLSEPSVDGTPMICAALERLVDELELLRAECHTKYPRLSEVAATHPLDTSKHLAELKTFSVLTTALNIEWDPAPYDEWATPPLIKSIDAAMAALRGQPRGEQ